EKEDDKSDTSSSQQQKSPQGLSDTGYSSDGISSSLGEIPSHIPSDEKDLLRESSKKDTVSQESPPSPSDLAKLESTVLSILEAQASTLSDEKSVKSKELYEMYSEQTKDQHKTKPLPVTPESYSSDEEDLEATQEGERTIVEDGKGSASSRVDYKKEEEGDDISARRQRYDSVEDSSESENSPVPRRKRRASVGSSSSDEYKRDDSQGSGDEEDFIRKQIIEMSADEDASGSEDDEFIRNQLKEISVTESQKKDEVKSKVKGTAGKHRRMARKSSAGYDEDAGRRHSWHDDDDETFDESPEPKYRETKSQDSEELAVTGGGGLRRFKTIELNSTITNKYSEASEQQKGILYFDEEPELEMESLTDSPEDRSRGEGSSSLHASSFTPGTSPTSVSSLDEDSDSSPSHKKLGGESKQQRKARHRSHGPLLPTIEDSSEEEELREEEELLKEQEKQRELEQQQRKSSSKKSKKDKDELRAQRRRERPKTPPSNLSPIEDASPTEELRQAAEMEELHRSSCSEYSPSIESDPEGFEISPEKIIEVQKVYKLPTAVSLYSPTDEQTIGLPKEESGQKALKSAEEVYEEMMHKTHKSKPFQIANDKDEVFEKESLYGGMLIEDYIYESLVEDTYNGTIDTNLVMRQDESNEYIQQRGKEKKIRASEQIYEEPQKITDLQKDYYSVETLHSIVPQEDIVSSSYIIPESHEIVVLDSTVTSTTEEKQLLDAEAAYEELMKRQKMQLTPGSSPTQPASGFIPTSDTKVSSVGEIVDSTSLTSSTTSAISDVSPVSSAALSIPDVKITQHFTAEEIEDEYLTDYAREIQEIISHETSMLTYSETLEGAASVLPSDTASLTSSTSSVCTTDSSSPIDSATTSYVDTADAVTKLADSEGVRIAAQVPLTSTKEYSEMSMPYESLAGATKKPSIESDMESVDQAAVCLPETAPSVVATTVIEPKQYATDTITFDISKAEKEAAKKMKSTVESGIVKILHEDSHKELGFDMTRISLTSATSEQSPECIASVPVTEPASETSSVPTPSVVSKTSIVSVPSSAPAVTSQPAETQPKPIGLSLTSSMTLNLVSAAEYKIASPTSPLSPHSNKSSPRLAKPSQETYVVITLPSEPGTPTEAITSQAVTSWPLEAPSKEQIPQPVQPIFTPSMKTMEIQSMADQSMYISGALQAIPVTTPSTFEKIPSSKSEVVTAEVTKTTVSVVKGPVPGFGLGSVAITIPPEPLHIVDQPRYRENGRFHPLGDVIDLRTLTKMDIEMRDSCMDLSAVSMDVRRQMPASDTCGRPVSTVQPAIINLSTACVADPSLPVVTETVAVMTCTTTVSYAASTDSLVDLGHAMTTPLQLTTSKHFEPVYRVTGRQAFSEGRDEVPINLSLGTSTHAVTWATTKPVTVPPVGVTNGWTDLSTSQEPMESGAVDLSTTKSHRTVVTMDETTSGIITTVIEDDEKPVDLTAGRRAVCCDMVYKLPFGRSCTAQQPPTTLPEDRFGYRDDHYQYDRSGSYGYRGIGGMKPSMSDTNLSEAGLFAYKSKNSFDYRVGATDAALQLEQFQQLQQQLHQQLEEQKIRQIYQYGYDPSGTGSPQTTTDQTLLEGQYATTENGQFWPTDDATTTASGVLGIEIPQSQTWYTVQSDGITQYIPRSGILSSVSEMSLKDIDVREEKQLKKRSSMPKLRGPYEELEETLEEEPRCFKKIVDSGVQTDDEDGADRGYTNRRRRTKKSVDTSVQTDDEDQDEWDLSSRSRRKPRVGKYSESTSEADKAKQFTKVSSIAVQTVAEISVQTEPVGTIRTPSIRARLDAKVEIIKHISAPEKTYKGESLGCQTETESDSQSPQYLSASSPQKDKKRPTPLEIGYSSHLRPDSTLQVVPSPPKSPKVLYSPISPVSPSKVIESAFVPYEKPITDDISPQKMLHADIAKVPPSSPKAAKMMQRSMSDPKPLSPTAEDSSRAQFQYTEGFMTKGSSSITPSGTQKKVKRTLPNPPPEEATAGTQSPYTSVGSVSRRRICRTNTMARAKILQDIDRELDLVERESAKLRKKQAELDEEEKEIDAKLRYLEMGINRRKEALLKEREKRERAYLQGVAEERDYMSDSEVNNTRSTRIETQHGLERPRTAPQTEFNQFMPPQTQPETQFAPATSPYAQYQYSSPALPTQAPTQFTQQSHYQQQPLYHQQVSPYQTQTAFQTGATMPFTPQAQPPPSQQPSYQLPSQMMVIQPKPRQTALYLEPKITTNYDVIRNQPLMIAPVSTDNNYAVSQLGSKYSTLDLRIGLDERNSIASSPISSISADSFYADIDHHHTPRNYVLIDDIGELTKGTGALGSSFSLHEKDLTKTDRLLRTTEARRAQEVTDFLAPLQTSSRLHSYVKADEDPMEDPYELKLLKHQIKQEFRRGAESLDHLAGLSQYYHAEGSYRHFPKSEKYSIGRLTLEKQAAKQLPAALLYQKQSKHKKALIDPKLTKFSPIQESRDLEPDYSSYMTSSTSTLGGITTRARLLQDDITFGLRKNITDQQKYMGPPLSSSIGASLGTALGATMRSALQDEADKSYSSGSRSRPSSRPSSVYGLDLSLKRDSSSSSLRLKAQEAEPLDVSFSHAAPSGRTKPTSLPISQSRGRIPIVAQNSEEESPLSPVGQPMGMARAAAGPLPPISADTRDQFGSSHSLPEVQQHMREESRTRGYDRDIAFIMDDFQHAMSDSEAYHLRREETDWFDKPRESRLDNGHGLDRRLPEKLSHSRPPSQHQDQVSCQINGKALQYIFPHARLKLLRDPKDHTVSGNGLGIRVVGGKEIPGSSGEIGAYIAKILPGGNAEQTGKLIEGMQVLEWNGIPLTGKTYEEVQSIIIQQSGEAEICVRLDLNMLSDSENPQHLELHEPVKAVDKAKSPGVDPKQLAAELQKVSLQQSPLVASSGVEKGSHVHSGTTSAASSAVPSPGQPGSPSVSKKRHSSKPTETTKSASHPITGEIQLQINYDKHLGNLIIHILQARNLAPRDNNGYSDPFVKVYLLPGRGNKRSLMQCFLPLFKFSAEYKRRTKYVQKSLNPEWNQTVIYKNISTEQLKKKTLEVTVWDYDRFSSNDFLGEVLIELSSISQLDNTPRWYPLKEQSENIDHGKPHSGQSSQQSPKPSVIKSRSHGIFPDPSKDMQVPTIEKSHSSPGSSKSSSEGHLRSHGPSRSQSKTSVTQTHLEDAGAAIAAAEAAVQQLRLQPTRSTNHRPAESSVSTGSSASSFGSGYSMDSEGSSSATGENNLFPIPRIGKMSQNGQEQVKPSGVGLTDAEGKTQVMGEIKIALKKEMKTDGEQLIVEILQCRNITYKFKSPDHLPDLYVKLYIVNISTQKRVIKKKTRVCRHDREPSFNETFRFSLSPAGHSLQILLVSNGGKFMKKTLIGEAYIWLDKVDLRKRIVNWHKLLVSSTQTH
ncbi:PCLO protein, partial [Ibidorhyncha struthersii]|nr:PCLO protein [Ibidorhyncha struthersii]